MNTLGFASWNFRGQTATSALAVALLAILLLPSAATAQSASPLQVDTTVALQQLTRGNLAAAAKRTRMALQAAPGDATLHILAGTVLLYGGDARAAMAAFENARTCDRDDALALYGLALAQMGCGDRTAAAATLARSAQKEGDPSFILVARRYLQYLDGAQIAPENAGLPDAFAPAQKALLGMALLRRGDTAQGAAQLEAAYAALPGDGIVEPHGALMTFDPAHALTGPGKLPADNGLAAPLPQDRGLQGVVQFTPQGANADVAYASYELDGKSLTLVNVRPFDYSWNSAEAPNGPHELRITLYDAQGQEISHATRRIRIANSRPAPGDAPRIAAWERLHAALWQALLLQPARFACAEALGHLYRAQGALDTARNWFARAAGSHPDADTRHQLAACGGLGSGGEALWGGRVDEKVVALTFDDGPSPGITEPLLEMLLQARVPATFFVIGRHVMEYPDLTRKLAEAGMEIANHSYTHPNLTRLAPEDVARELMETQAAVQTVVGKKPRFMRPPGGNWNPEVARIVREWGLIPCMWTVDVYGSEVIGAQQVADAVLNQVRPGSIILMHNGKMSTLQALPTIIRALRERGYTFATVDALERRLEAAREAARLAANRAAESAALRRTE